MAAVVGYVGAFYAAKQNAHSTAGGDITITDPSGGELDFASDASFSVEMWVAAQSDQSATGDLISKGPTTAISDAGWKLGILAGKADWTIHDGTNQDTVVSVADVANDVWTHLIGVKDVTGNEVRLYTDAIEANTATLTASDLSNASDVVIGDGTNSNAVRVGLVRVYSHAITDAQASDLWKGGFPGAILGDVECELMFHEGTGTNLKDSSKNDNDGTASSGSWVATTYDTQTSEAVGTGTGSQTVFALDKENVEYDPITVTVGGTAKRIGADFALTPKGTLTFNTAPASDAAVVATYRNYPMTVEAGGFTAWSVDMALDVPDCTDFRSTGWRSFKAALKGWTGSAENFWINPIGYGLFQKRVIIKFVLDEPDNKYLTGWGIVNGFSPTDPVDALLTQGLSFQGTQMLGTEVA